LLSHRIAHDLRGLFFILSSYFEMQSESNEEEKEEKKVIIENLQRMKYMITEVTKYGKPSVKEKEIINPVDFLENMVAVARLFEGAEELKFKKDFPDNFKFSIWASRQELQNAFFNIFKNAVEAFGEVKGKKIIEVSVKKIGKKIQIIISDLGIGINEGILKDVFLNPVTTKKDGTGVGLLIIKNAIENNGGTIDIKKRKGHKRYYALP
ncbi:MAG: HAMP domain-containing sensor histidine kinase, partial [Elusimicrobiota bacterium]|nr:HAMP domain-containing sensor histidine kinase [Elusimicrobiota bacterium]